MRSAYVSSFSALLWPSLRAVTRSGQARRTGRPAADAVAAALRSRSRRRPLQRMAIERQVDLSGTLVSPDQAKVSSEVAGIVREVPVQLGTEVRAGDVLVRLEPRELALALERAESALRQVEAQLGIDRAATASSRRPTSRSPRSVRRSRIATTRSTPTTAREQLNGRGLLSQGRPRHRRHAAEGGGGELPGGARQRPQPEGQLQDRRASYELAQKKLNDAVDPRAGRRLGLRAARAARRIHPREHAGRHDRADEPAEAEDGDSGEVRRRDPAGPGGGVRGRGVSRPDVRRQGRVRQPAVDQATRTFAVEALVDNADRVLKPGFFAKGTISTQVDDNVMAVPDDAVSTLAGVSTVYVIEDGKARQQIVDARRRTRASSWEIVDGLKGDETLAASQLNQLATGMSVTTGDGGGRAGGSGRRTRPRTWPAASGGRRRPMMISDVSVKRPVFAIMMTAALIVLGAFSYRELGLDLMPKTDAPVVNVRSTCRAPAPRKSRRRSPSASRRRSTRSAASTSCARPPIRATRASASRSRSSATSKRRRRTSATRSPRSSASSRATRKPPQIQKIDPDAAPILTFAVYGPRAPKELTEIADKQIKQDLETLQGRRRRSASTASASARSSCCSTPTA